MLNVKCEKEDVEKNQSFSCYYLRLICYFFYRSRDLRISEFYVDIRNENEKKIVEDGVKQIFTKTQKEKHVQGEVRQKKFKKD